MVALLEWGCACRSIALFHAPREIAHAFAKSLHASEPLPFLEIWRASLTLEDSRK